MAKFSNLLYKLMSSDNEFEKESLTNFLYLNSCFYDFMNKSFGVYKKVIEGKIELTFQEIKETFQKNNKENEELFDEKECLIINSATNAKNEKIQKIKSFLDVDLNQKCDQIEIFNKLDKLAYSYYKILSKEQNLLILIGEKFYRYIYKSYNLYYLIIKMIKKNESINYNELLKKYESQQYNYKKEKTDLKNEINKINQSFSSKTKELNNKYNEINNKYNNVIKEFQEVNIKYKQTTSKYNEVNNDYKQAINKLNEANNKYNEVNNKYNEVNNKYNEVNNDYKQAINKLNEANNKYNEINNNYNQDINKLNNKYNEVNLKYSDVLGKLREETRKYNEVIINNNEIKKILDEMKKENNFLKKENEENKNDKNILKEMLDGILEKLKKDQQIYDTYEAKICNAIEINSQLNNYIEIQKIELNKKTSEIERLKFQLEFENVAKNINEKKKSK